MQVLQLLEEAHFTYRTIEEARGLAAVLANACPDAEATVIGLTELLVNAVEHGNLGITYDDKSALLAERRRGWTKCERRLELPENRGKRVDVEFCRGDDELRFTIRDRGNGFEWTRYLDIDPRRAFDRHGRGIIMARHVSFSSIEYRGTRQRSRGHRAMRVPDAVLPAAPRERDAQPSRAASARSTPR